MTADELDTALIRALHESDDTAGCEHFDGVHWGCYVLRLCDEVDRLRAAGGVQPAPAAEAIVEQILKLCHHHEGLIPPRAVKTALLIGTIARMRREASAGSTDQPPAEVCDSHGQQFPCSECAAANGPSAAGSTDGAGTPTEWRQEICWTLMPAAFGDTGQRVCIRTLPCPDHGVTAGQGAIIGNLQAPIDRSAGSAVTTPGAHACPYGCECPEHNPAHDPGCGISHPHSRTSRCAGD